MYCSNCGKQIDDGAKFCTHCGAKQTDTIPKDKKAELPVKSETTAPEPAVPKPAAPESTVPETTAPEQSAENTRSKSLTLIIGSVIVGIAIIAAAMVFAFRPGSGSAPENVTVTMADKETSAEMTSEPTTTEAAAETTEKAASDNPEKLEVESLYSSLASQNMDGAFDSEKELLVSYKAEAERCIQADDLEAARTELGKWQNLIHAIQGAGRYTMSVEQVDVSEYPNIRIYVRVQENQTQKAVNTLKQDGFHIYEKLEGSADFVRRDIIRALQLDNAESVNIAMVSDVSGSMDGTPIVEAKKVMNNFLNSVQTQAGDRISLISFADQVEIQTPFTGDMSTAQTAVNNMVPYGRTAFYDALYVAINQTAAQKGAKCVIAFTDGKDNVSKCTPEIIAQLARRYSIPIFIIGVGNDLDTSRLTYITDATNGFYKNVSEINSMTEIYDAIFREQKELYLVEYETLQQDDKDVIRNLNLDYVDDTIAARQEYQYVPSVYMEVNVSMAQMFVNDFIIYDSDRRYVTSADLDRLTKEELRLARNEIYARRGRMFNDQYLQGYFNSKGWYSGSVAPDAFNEGMFNDYERANAYFIADYERLKGFIK